MDEQRIELVPHRDIWAHKSEVEKKHIEGVLMPSPWRIEHIYRLHSACCGTAGYLRW